MKNIIFAICFLVFVPTCYGQASQNNNAVKGVVKVFQEQHCHLSLYRF